MHTNVHHCGDVKNHQRIEYLEDVITFNVGQDNGQQPTCEPFKSVKLVAGALAELAPDCLGSLPKSPWHCGSNDNLPRSMHTASYLLLHELGWQGSNSAINNAIMAITTSNSMSVKPIRLG